jgi:PAS domain S-box-containing protein
MRPPAAPVFLRRAQDLGQPLRYGLALAITAGCLGLRFLLQPLVHAEAPFATFYIGNIIAAVYLGLGPAMLATVAGAVATAYFFIPPLNSFELADFSWIILYSVASFAVIFFVEREHRAQRRAEHAMELAEERYETILRETAAKEAAQRSEERQRRWAQVTLSSIGDAVISTDGAGCVNFLNPVAETLTGWSMVEAAGKPIGTVFDIYSQSTGEAAQMPVEKALRTGLVQALANDTVLVSKAGKRTPIDDSAAPIRDVDGELIGVVLVFRDITARKKQEEALRRSNEDLKKFAFVASHDLQEPLRTVAGFLGLIRARYQQQFDADGLRFIQFAVDGTHRMQALIRDLLQYSRVGTRALKLAPADLNHVMDEIQANIRSLLSETGATIRRDPLPTVIADALKVGLVLQNLLSNSLKFRSDAPPEIRITGELRGDEWIVGVHDNGIGFDPQYAARIFEMFERLHGVGIYPGSGIGLAICKRIIEEHGGHIWAESKPGAGSSFYFTLPAEGASAMVSGLVRGAGA